MKKYFLTIFIFLLNIVAIFAQPSIKTVYDEVEFNSVSGDETKENWIGEITTLWDKNKSEFQIELKEQLKDKITTKKTLILNQISPWEKKLGASSAILDMCLTESSEFEKYIIVFCSNTVTMLNYITIMKYENQKIGFTLLNYSAEASGGESETIVYINKDLQSALVHYVASRKGKGNFTLNLESKLDNDSLKIFYASEDIKLNLNDSKKNFGIPFTSTNSHHSILYKSNFNKSVTFNNGIYTYKNDSTKTQGNRYGFSTNSDKGFRKYKYSWIIPDNIEIIKYSCNRKGNWVVTENNIIFSSENVNNVLFEISFKIKNTPSKEIEKTQVNLKETVKVPNGKVSISIWDNNVEDGDMISLSLNGSWIVRNLVVSKCKVMFGLNLDQKDNYLIMKAENVGSRPPNTASFLIESQGFQKEVILNSDLGKSEMLNIQLE